ncbi:MAG: SpoIID/LytB domain-containing protein [Vicinamibacterales bacterium]
MTRLFRHARSMMFLFFMPIALAGCFGAPVPPRPPAPSEPLASRHAPSAAVRGSLATSSSHQVPAKAAWAMLLGASPRLVEEAHPEILDTPVQPGSLMKIVTLAAAAEAGLVNAETGMMCARRVRNGTHVLDCSHPDLHRPLTAVEALAHSCNSFFAQLARRLTHAQLATAASRLGLPPVPPETDMVLAALGIDGYRVPPRRWLSVLSKIRDGAAPLRAQTRALLVSGLREAAGRGTADALANHGPWLAKTGTAAMPGGGVEGLLVAAAAAPDNGDGRPGGVVVVAPGASGKDAAAIAAALIESRSVKPGPPSSAGIERSHSERPDVPAVRLGRANATGYSVESMPLESYVAGVLAAEAPPDIAPAALSALATVTRTYALKQMKRHDVEGFDVCDLTHCQVVKPPTPKTLAAAGATRGLVLMAGDTLAEVYYSASCGGTLASADEVWGDAARASSAGSIVDPAGRLAREVEWSTDLTASQIIDVLRAAGLSGRVLEDFRVVTRSASGRVAWLRATGFSPDRISGERFRMMAGRLLGWQTVKSTRFEVARTAGGFTLVGRGHGHGVGLCVRGAAALGVAWSAEDILAAYFPKTRLERLPDAGGPNAADVQVVVPWGDQPRSEALRHQARRIVANLAERLGVTPPAPIRIRFHASVAAYQRSTAAGWWTAGRTRGTVVDLLPLGVLEARGLLERTLRHELIHVLTEPVLRGRPRWVREGLAARLDGFGTRPSTQSTPECPPDRAFETAGSAQTLQSLYEQSAACVGAALSDGGDWRDVGATSRSNAHPNWVAR